MSIEGTAQTEYASLSGKIHTFVVDKTLSISGACADAAATGEAIDGVVQVAKDEATRIAEASIDDAKEAALDAVRDLAEETAREAAVDSVESLVDEAISNLGTLSVEEIRAICV